ncbi:unnamed protein product [Durusdinium trenchii]|uniref:Autoinducer 2-degrading protein LsrG n=2 Tax=Durusdinium trenchii TaxID=1381693 RepID=A0ABP0N053_9DINO
MSFSPQEFPLRIQSEKSEGSASRRVVQSFGSQKSSGRLASTNSAKRKSVAVNSNFIKAKTKGFEGDSGGDWRSKIVICASRMTTSSYFINFMALVVLVDAYCTCWDIDARAAELTPDREVYGQGIAQQISDVCLMFYTLELSLALIASGWVLLRDWAVALDLIIVCCGYAEMLIYLIGGREVLFSFGFVRILRLIRIFRLTRLLRKTRALRELQKLVRMMATCLKALVWSFVFCFMIMTVWAMLLVEWVHPCVNELYMKGVFDECGLSCLIATSSVMEANLLLFKTVIAGDSWGLIAVPVIQEFPATAILFCGSLLTLVFGVLNLIVAVVVDNFAEARQRDVLNLAEEMEDSLDKDTKFLEAIFQRIDEDGSGQVTFEELVEGARKDKEFQSRLRVMDIDEADLQQLFEMIDSTEEGSIDLSQFIAPMTRWVHDSKTAPRFIKYNMMRTLHQQEELLNMCEALSMRIDNIADHMGVLPPEEDLLASFQVSSSKRNPRWGKPRSSSPSISPQRSWNMTPFSPPSWQGNVHSNVGSTVAIRLQEELGLAGDDEARASGEEVEQPHRSTPMVLSAAPALAAAEPLSPPAALQVERVELERAETTEVTVQAEAAMSKSSSPQAPTTQESSALKSAMLSLESLVVDATRGALRSSLRAVETALQERWSTETGRSRQEEMNLTRILERRQRRNSSNGHRAERRKDSKDVGIFSRFDGKTSMDTSGERPESFGSFEQRRQLSPSPFAGRQASQEFRYRRNSTTGTNNSDFKETPPNWRSRRNSTETTHTGELPKRLSRSSGDRNEPRPLIGGFSPPGTASMQLQRSRGSNERSGFSPTARPGLLPTVESPSTMLPDSF